MLASSEFETVALITDLTRYRVAYDLQWSLEALQDVVLIDFLAPNPPTEIFSQHSVSAFWDQIAESATDRVSAAGFIRSEDGSAFGDADVDAYRNCVLTRAKPFIGKDKKSIYSALSGFTKIQNIR